MDKSFKTGSYSTDINEAVRRTQEHQARKNQPQDEDQARMSVILYVVGAVVLLILTSLGVYFWKL